MASAPEPYRPDPAPLPSQSQIGSAGRRAASRRGLPLAFPGSPGSLVLLFFLVLRRSAEGNRRFARVLVVVAEIDHFARAVRRAALAAPDLRMHRQQVLLGIAQPDVLVVGGRFHV